VLAPEEARARLTGLRNDAWRDQAAKRVRKLPRRQRSIGRALLDVRTTDRGEVRPADDGDGFETAAAELDALAAGDRTDLFTALHPQLGPTFGRLWVDLRNQPYQTGWSRKAFRAPNEPALTRRTRMLRLFRLVHHLGPYAHDVAWVAAWAPHLVQHEHGGAGGMLPGRLLASAIDAGGEVGDRVFDTLVEVGNGEHPVGTFGQHVIVGLLGAARPDGWEFVERLLLAAQRQEGLRQSILEAVDEAHPEAFRRMLAVVLDHDLMRFASSVRAAAVWFGMPADVTEIPRLTERVRLLQAVLTDHDRCREALETGDGWETYVALCAVAMHDVAAALRWIPTVHGRPESDARAALVRFLTATALTSVGPWIVHMTTGDDLDVAMLAALQITPWPGKPYREPANTFDALAALAARLPERPRQGSPVGIEIEANQHDRGPVVVRMLGHLDQRPLDTMLPWLPSMNADARVAFARMIAERRRLTPGLRQVVFQLLGDRSSTVRHEVATAAARLDLEPSEAGAVEALLSRRSGDTRRTAIALLTSQRPARIAESAQRLWDSGNEAQRDAASELLALLPASVSGPIGARWAEEGASDRQRELIGLDTGADPGASAEGDRPEPPISADDPGLGLYDPARRAAIPAPRAHDPATIRGSEAVLQLVSELDDLAHEYRNTPVTVANWQGSRDQLLADVRWFPSPFARQVVENADDEGGQGLVLADAFRPWWNERSPPGWEGIRALRALVPVELAATTRWQRNDFQVEVHNWERSVAAGPTGELRHPALVRHVLQWMTVEHADATTVDLCLDALETLFATVPRSLLRGTEPSSQPRNWDWRNAARLPWNQTLLGLHARTPELFGDAHITRWFHLQRWFDEPVRDARRRPVERRVLLEAHRIGAATDDDIRDAFLGLHRPLLNEATQHRRTQLEQRYPRVAALADELRDRIVEIERTRGELPTAASASARSIGSVSGSEIATELLSRLGRSVLVRGWGGGTGREAVYSRLLQVSHPADDETPESLRAAAKRVKVTDQRLLELAMYAPQWANLVQGALAWDGLADAIWWFHAHTKDSRWTVAPEVRELWTTLSAERTPLSSDDLLEGAVDVGWFHRVHEQLGGERWTKVHKVGKLASGGSGHRRAQLFAEALLADVDEATLVERITAKRNQDAVRALGLLPLPDDPTDREAVVLRRYGTLREFERGSAKFGSQRRASERTAVRIGVENLARTTGFVDPQRFIWSTEAAEAGDLAHGPIEVTEGEVTVSLAVDAEGVADITVQKAGKPLKSVPSALRKHDAIKELRGRKTALTRQATRVRRSLEDAMVRQETFTDDDLQLLDGHPVLAPMLRLAVFVDQDGRIVRRDIDGFVDVGGAAARPSGNLRLAHPLDLLASGEWIDWQERLFVDATRQPFKQVFRELYVLTEAERATSPLSRRYEGHQLQPRQAMALFGNRGWMTDRETGDVWRVFHQHGMTARVEFLDGFLTVADVELPTISAVYFTSRAEYLAQPLDSIPPIVFSETMRDLDLVVSVAHAGGVDPEASASTVEMRAALARETARLAQLDNVRIEHHHLLIDGALGEYSIHLGSGVVHRRPGGAICIIPVSSQRRGRLFLPFADDDPKTAEVMSKMLLLAHDSQIKDPSILDQLR
jgi:hypothetical protein